MQPCFPHPALQRWPVLSIKDPSRLLLGKYFLGWMKEQKRAHLLASCHLIFWDKPSSFCLEIQGHWYCTRLLFYQKWRKLRWNVKVRLFQSKFWLWFQEKEWNIQRYLYSIACCLWGMVGAWYEAGVGYVSILGNKRTSGNWAEKLEQDNNGLFNTRWVFGNFIL